MPPDEGLKSDPAAKEAVDKAAGKSENTEPTPPEDAKKAASP
ncbi:MAG: hypothetical protein QM811_05440 [Pirellulales bacterium]